MIKDFNAFSKAVEGLIIIRSANYVNTNCDIAILIETAWQDMNDIIFDWKTEEYPIANAQQLLTLSSIFDGYNLGDPMRIRYKDNYVASHQDVAGLVTKLSLYEYDISRVTKKFIIEDISSKLIITRPAYYDIEKLPSELYDKVFSCIVSGVMHYIENAIPSQVDNPISMNTYTQFQNSIAKLKNQYPQVILP